MGRNCGWPPGAQSSPQQTASKKIGASQSYCHRKWILFRKPEPNLSPLEPWWAKALAHLDCRVVRPWAGDPGRPGSDSIPRNVRWERCVVLRHWVCAHGYGTTENKVPKIEAIYATFFFFFFQFLRYSFLFLNFIFPLYSKGIKLSLHVYITITFFPHPLFCCNMSI